MAEKQFSKTVTVGAECNDGFNNLTYGGGYMNYRFEDIAGYEKEKAELMRLCELFNNREKYEAKGAKMPKGIIFYGGAGTGKTLFAKVMASACNLRIFKIDLGNMENESEICKVIKNTFEEAARCNETAMVFFDEVDKVLPNRTEDYTTDRSKTVLTQLLTLIDGMDSAKNIVFVATCNSYGTLPATLTRPGRIDKKIGFGLPNYPSRIAILKMYAEKTSCKFEVTMEELAKLAHNFSCAALETLINECVLQSDENGVVSKKLVYERIFEIKHEDIPREKSTLEDTICACHNIGSFIVARTMNDGHYILNLENDTVCNDFFNRLLADYDDDYGGNDCDDDDDDEEYDDENEEKDEEQPAVYYCKNDYLNAITVRIGGFVAEEVIFNKVYDHVGHDLSLLDTLLSSMAWHGMFGLDLHFDFERHRGTMPYLPERVEKLNALFDKIKANCYKNARLIIEKNEELIKKLIPILTEKQVIDKEDCEPILQSLGGVNK